MAGDKRPLEGKWEGWTQHGGGARFSITGPGEITLTYNCEGFGYYGHASNRSSSRPWQASVGRKTLRDNAGRARIFGSRESARKAAEEESRL